MSDDDFCLAGNILENKELLASLNQTKASSTTISDSLKESIRLQADLDKVSETLIYSRLNIYPFSHFYDHNFYIFLQKFLAFFLFGKDKYKTGAKISSFMCQ